MSNEFVTFKHKKYARYSLGGFEFEKYLCRVPKDQEEKFLKLLSGFPAHVSSQIVIYNEEAAAGLEKAIESTVVRNATGSADTEAKMLQRSVVEGAGESKKGETSETETPEEEPSEEAASETPLAGQGSTKPNPLAGITLP